MTRFIASKILIYIFFIFVGTKTADPMSGFFIFKKTIYIKNKKKLSSQIPFGPYIIIGNVVFLILLDQIKIFLN